MDNLVQLLGEYFYNEIGVDHNSEYIITTVDAKELIIKDRMDLMAKYIFVESFDKKIISNIPMDIYISHLKAFNAGEISEPGNDEKNSLDDYLSVFLKLIDEIKYNGFDIQKSIIPVDSNGVIFDGSHRVSISAYYKKKLPIVYFSNTKAPINDYEYFLKRGMKEIYMDLLALKYCEFKDKNIYLCCIWPITHKYQKLKDIDLLIRNAVSIVYKKSIRFNYNGLRNFQILSYDKQEWIGGIENHFSGIDGKVNSCYYKANTLFYIIESNNIKYILELKEKIRKIVGIGKHSVHITDNYHESLYLIRHILNPNTILFINSYEPFANEELIAMINSKDVSNEPLDVLLTLLLHNITVKGIKNINNLQNIEKFDFIFDYRNYIFFKGLKFVSKECCIKLDPENTNMFNKITYKSGNNRINNIKVNLQMFIYRLKVKVIKSIVESKSYRIVRPYYKLLVGRLKK